MDTTNYKSLIDELSKFSECIPDYMRDDDGNSDVALRAADAIEALLKERNAMLHDMYGVCDCCARAEPGGQGGVLLTCAPMRKRLVSSFIAHEVRDCDYWKWCGLKEE